MRIFFLVIGVLAVHCLQAQYWFGPKIGGHRTDFVYQEPAYKDTFSIKEDYNFHVGGVLIYQATQKYAVQAELTYERITKEVLSQQYTSPAYSKMNLNYLMIPFALRWNFGSEPTHIYVSGGPKISFLLGGSGRMELDEFDEFRGGEPLVYRLVFDQDKADGNTKLALTDVNRVQFGLAFGTGMYFDLRTGGRFSIDLRYAFGHSNVGFNQNASFNEFAGYSENFRYRQNVLSLSLAYLFEYDVELQSKGKSTIQKSNRDHKTGKNQKRRN